MATLMIVGLRVFTWHIHFMLLSLTRLDLSVACSCIQREFEEHICESAFGKFLNKTKQIIPWRNHILINSYPDHIIT